MRKEVNPITAIKSPNKNNHVINSTTHDGKATDMIIQLCQIKETVKTTL